MKLTSLLMLGIFSFLPRMGCSQPPADRPHCSMPAFDEKVARTISFSVPTIGTEELKQIQHEVVIFDARKKEEYEVSHIPGARYLGYSDFDPGRLEDLPKDSKIVLYCSIGYRSEKIGEKLQKMGYTNVYNLYGSIFDWINRGYPVLDGQGRQTRKVHTYNRNWSQWVDGNKAEKVW